MAVITLTTDFGLVDGYVGAMKGVILSWPPNASLVDISHDVLPQDVRHGSRLLASAAPFFPVGTIHVAVIDPGVGSLRRGIALRTAFATFVGPDNGLFSSFFQDRVACVNLNNPATHRIPVSPTFHGRDVFAPVAAHLANGMPLEVFGPPIDDPLVLSEPRPFRMADGRLRAQIRHVDRFGNLITNLGPLVGASIDLKNIDIAVEDASVIMVRTFSEVAPGTLLGLVGSDGYLEIAVCEGSAAQRLVIGVGAIVDVWGI